ncbi:Fic family protein [bacterium]|nr:Fic family protein [bacterium]
MSTFEHKELRLIEPAFGSPLTDLIIELDHLRKKRLGGSTMPWIFFQLKAIFHLLESIGSARIEGNNTTVAEYIETKLQGRKSRKPNIIEIENMEKAMKFVDTHIGKQAVHRAFISELHKLVVEGLPLPPGGEGDRTPGLYREHPISIANSDHVPPPSQQQIEAYMDELTAFIAREDAPKYDLMKTAIAHHRFMWIHPFGNGNGRTGRLLTYALLVKQGFAISKGRIVNPTAVFCISRKNYYDFLGEADSGTDEGLLRWCRYVLSGLKNEIEKIDRLLDHRYLEKEILIPALKISLDRKQITELEFRILEKAVRAEEQLIQAADVRELVPGKIPQEISRVIRNLKDKKMLLPVKEKRRKYHIRFENNYLLRSVMQMLDEKGFLSVKD